MNFWDRMRERMDHGDMWVARRLARRRLLRWGLMALAGLCLWCLIIPAAYTWALMANPPHRDWVPPVVGKSAFVAAAVVSMVFWIVAGCISYWASLAWRLQRMKPAAVIEVDHEKLQEVMRKEGRFEQP